MTQTLTNFEEGQQALIAIAPRISFSSLSSIRRNLKAKQNLTREKGFPNKTGTMQERVSVHECRKTNKTKASKRSRQS